jgi:hypothetical protein
LTASLSEEFRDNLRPLECRDMASTANRLLVIGAFAAFALVVTQVGAQVLPLPDELVKIGTLVGQASSCNIDKERLRRMVAYSVGVLGVLSRGNTASHDAWAPSLLKVVADAKNSQATDPSSCPEVVSRYDRIENNLLMTGFLPP